jgi:hypothetical protein
MYNLTKEAAYNLVHLDRGDATIAFRGSVILAIIP